MLCCSKKSTKPAGFSCTFTLLQPSALSSHIRDPFRLSKSFRKHGCTPSFFRYSLLPNRTNCLRTLLRYRDRSKSKRTQIFRIPWLAILGGKLGRKSPLFQFSSIPLPEPWPPLLIDYQITRNTRTRNVQRDDKLRESRWKSSTRYATRRTRFECTLGSGSAFGTESRERASLEFRGIQSYPYPLPPCPPTPVSRQPACSSTRTFPLGSRPHPSRKDVPHYRKHRHPSRWSAARSRLYARSRIQSNSSTRVTTNSASPHAAEKM